MTGIEIVTVNYNTPDLIERLIKSVRQLEGDIPVRIIDGSDEKQYIKQIAQIADKYSNVKLEPQGWNIHHGRGLDLAVKTSRYDYCICIDSDVYFKKSGLIEKVKGIVNDNIKLIGFSVHVNSEGITKSPSPETIEYLHPSFLLVDVNYYYENNEKLKFIHHGAPCIKMMKHLDETGEINKLAYSLNDGNPGMFDQCFAEYLSFGGRGTVSRFGYNIR